MGDKYKIDYDGEARHYAGHSCHRIIALRDFECAGRKVKAGDVGGFVQSEDNLSQKGTCWIFDDAIAEDMSRVSGDAALMFEASAYDVSTIKDHAVLANYARAGGAAIVCGNALMLDSTVAFEEAKISGDAIVFGNAKICGCARVSGNVVIGENSQVKGFSEVFDNAQCGGNTWVYKGQVVCGDMTVGLDEGQVLDPFSGCEEHILVFFKDDPRMTAEERETANLLASKGADTGLNGEAEAEEISFDDFDSEDFMAVR